MIIKRVDIKQINAAPFNPRQDLKPDDAEYQKLLRSLDTFGCVEPLVWNQRSGYLVSGHQRLKILLARGDTEIDVSIVDLSSGQERALNIALNKISGEWDWDKLSELLAGLIDTPDIDVALTGFDLPEIEELIADFDDEEEDPDAEDTGLDTSGPSITQPDDLIELGLHGEHRLFCADATKLSDAAPPRGLSC